MLVRWCVEVIGRVVDGLKTGHGSSSTVNPSLLHLMCVCVHVCVLCVCVDRYTNKAVKKVARR